MNDDWASFDEETQRQRQAWEFKLELWRLEVVSTRCSFEVWPSSSTRACYVLAMAELEICRATLDALPVSSAAAEAP